MLMCEAAGAAHNQEQKTERGVRFTASELRSSSANYSYAGAIGGGKRKEAPPRGRAWKTGPEMPPPQHPARINLQELKAQIVKKVGHEKAREYFDHFSNFISSNLKKAELDKLVILTIGKENVALHNQLIRAILNNAIRAEVPPAPPLLQDTSKPVKGVRRKPLVSSTANDDSSPSNPASPALSVWSNGDAFTSSPRKGRSGIRDRKANKDRPSTLGPQGKAESNVSQGEDAAIKTEINGNFKSPDLLRPSQEIQGTAEQPDAELIGLSMPPVKRLRIINRSEVPVEGSGTGGVQEDPVQVEEEDVEDQSGFLLGAGGTVKAPLGIPFCSASVGSARKYPFVGLPGPLGHLLLVDGTEEELLEAADLPDADTLQRRMEQIAANEGLHGVSRDCAIQLNQGLDAFLKRLIKASVDLVASRSSWGAEMQASCKDSGLLKDKELKKDACSPAFRLHQRLNGVSWAGPSLENMGARTSMNVTQKETEKLRSPVSLLDFKVAMELNPQQLGEDWPLQLEKISFFLCER